MGESTDQLRVPVNTELIISGMITTLLVADPPERSIHQLRMPSTSLYITPSHFKNVNLPIFVCSWTTQLGGLGKNAIDNIAAVAAACDQIGSCTAVVSKVEEEKLCMCEISG
jgi:hypothetical protein